jgi:hypothetical protein
LILAFAVKSPIFRGAFQAFSLAGLFTLLVVPARLFQIQDSQAVAVEQITGLLVFLIILLSLLGRRSGGGLVKRFFTDRRGMGLVLLGGAILAIPWVLIGALGSPTDIILELLVSGLFSLCVILTLEGTLLRLTQVGYAHKGAGSVLYDGLVASLTLLIMITGLAQSGNQLILSLSVPILGFSLVLISDYASQQAKSINWPAMFIMIWLATAWPLLWVDADELMLVSNGGPGQLIQWANLAASISLGLGILFTIVLLALWRKFQSAGGFSIYSQIAVSILWIGIALVYVFLGRPGFFGERLFVILKSQPDVSSAEKINDYNQRRSMVYQTLVKNADSTQDGLRKSLDSIGIHYTPYYLVNGLEVQGGPSVRWWLMSRPEVDRILDNPILRPLPGIEPVSKGTAQAPASPEWNLTSIEADRVWNELKVTGQGVIVGQSDTGVQSDHPELAASYRGKNGDNNYNWFDPWYHSQQPYDIEGHGTHTLGSILGKKVGVAPGATWIACVNLARNLGNPAYYLDCMQFNLAPFPLNGNPFRDGDPARGAMVLNNSWGCPTVEGCDANIFLPAVKALRSAGVFVVVSAGNSGYSGCGSLTDPPAIYGQVYSVGAVDSLGDLASFSSLGPVTVDGSDRIKPDITAPGVNVLSAFPQNTYEEASGTSMAGPHVVGVVALMWSANPALIGDIAQTTQILDQSASGYKSSFPSCVTNHTPPNDASGYGIVDAYSAVKLALDVGVKSK